MACGQHHISVELYHFTDLEQFLQLRLGVGVLDHGMEVCVAETTYTNADLNFLF
jgi:hypothetical protein